MIDQYLVLKRSIAAVSLSVLPLCASANIVGGDAFELSDHDRPGAWCWFQDERVVVDTSNPDREILLTGVVTFAKKGHENRGDIDLYWLNLNSVGSGELDRGRFELHDRLQMDDHASPAFMIRPDGRYLTTWSLHGGRPEMYYRISTNPGDPTEWSPMMTFTDDGTRSICYTNPHYLSEANDGEGQIFLGMRSRGFDSNFILSDDLGETWRYGGRTIDAPDSWPNKRDGGRAYVKYTGDGKKRVHIFTTDDHPRINFNEERTAPGDLLNSLYHGYIEDGKLYHPNGTVVDEDLSDPQGMHPLQLHCLLKDGTEDRGGKMRRGWIVDLNVDPDGQPFGIIQFRADDNPEDHRYFFCRYNGKEWQVNFLAYAGDYFGWKSEADYTGLAAVDPANPDVVFVSTSADPATGEPLVSEADGQVHQELFMGKTADSGKTWDWTALTKDSEVDNLRPIVPKWKEGKSVVLWMRGNYPRFYVYDTKIMGMIVEH